MSDACRDWLATLWPASYMGVPFFFDSDEEDWGRGLKVHEYPGRDDPFVEDLGQVPHIFKGAAYVHGDDVDAQANTLTAALASPGPGTLVIPLFGPVQVHAKPFTRKHEKDKLGYVAYTVEFIAVGATQALVSIPFAAQDAFDAADGAASALATLFVGGLRLIAEAQFVVVVAAPVAEVEAIAAALEVLRTSHRCDPDVSATIAAADGAIFLAAPLLLTDPADVADSDIAALLAAVPPLDDDFTDPAATLAAAVAATIRALGDGMDGATAAAAMLDLAQSFPALPVSNASGTAARAGANQALVTTLGRLGALIAWAEALVRQTYASRPDGVAARAAVAERFDQELSALSGADSYPLYVALSALRGAVVTYLTQLIADLAPVVTVTASAAMPSLWWAWRLYQDPSRAVDLALRNSVPHPSFMPLDFAALAPGFAAPASLPTNWS